MHADTLTLTSSTLTDGGGVDPGKREGLLSTSEPYLGRHTRRSRSSPPRTRLFGSVYVY